MSHLLRALPDMLRVGFAGVVAYRAEMIIWMLSTLLPLVMLALWNAVAAGGPIAGLDQTDLARYFAATLLVRQLTSVWLVWEVNFEIRTGKLSSRLLKPMHPLIQHGVDMIAAVPFRALVLVPLLLALLVWRPDIWHLPSLPAAALFVVSLVLGWAINFLVQSLFAVMSFWFDKTDSLFGLWFAVWGLLSGYLAPLALFPEAVRPALVWLPFRGMLGLPVEILGGFIEPTAALPEVGIQVMWVTVLSVAVVYGWRAGVRRYGAFGA